jgi:hypothetical protein
VRNVQLTSESRSINTPAGQQFKQFLAGEGSLALSGLSYLILPEGPVAANQRWNHTSPVQLAIGNFQREATYQLAKTEKRGDRLLPRVKLSWNLTPKAEAGPALPGEPEQKEPVRIENQKNDGEFLFDTDAGYAVEATLQQQMTVISRAASHEVKQQISSSTKMKIRPLPKGSSRKTG